MRIKLIVPVLLAVAVSACRPVSGPPVAANEIPEILNEPLWETARDISFKAEQATNKQDKAALAQKGIAYSDKCIMSEPENAACYYYKAVNTGIYYEAHIAGYQKGLKEMVENCHRIIELDEKFEHGGAYRILGKIYTDVPESTLEKNGITKNTELAINYLKKAVAIDPNYPENYIYLTQAYLAAGKNEDARQSLTLALDLTPQWKNHRDYTFWVKANKDIAKKLN